MESQKMGVYYIVAHLIITLAIIGAYIAALMTGKNVNALEMVLYAIIGYWFGAMDLTNIKDLTRKKKGKEKDVA